MLTLFFFLIHPNMSFWKISLLMIFMSFSMMLFSMNIFFSNLFMNLGCDILSYFLIFLSIFIFSLSILSSKNSFNKNYLNFIILILFKMVNMLFITSNLMFFYIIFELSLIPMMMLILGWGMKIERFQASIYFMLYTMFSSLPFLYELLLFIFLNQSNFMFINYIFNYIYKDFFFIFFLNFAFLVKMPIFLFHLWLPKAHVEAPVGGSMILAGILLKLGGYGLMRIMFLILENMYKYSSFLISFSLWGGLIISFSCLTQLDLKVIVAFSSISHMSIMIAGLYSMSKMGLYGSFLIMIAHGLTSSGLFFLVNIFYERTKTRSLIFNKGFINISPNLSFSSFLIISAGMAAPISINLMSEFLLSFSILFMNKIFTIILFFIFLMSVGYSMYMYSFSQHGKLYKGMYFFSNIYVLEYMIIFLHWIPTNLMIFKSDMLIMYF